MHPRKSWHELELYGEEVTLKLEDFKLPETWKVKGIPRKSGKLQGYVDKNFFSPDVAKFDSLSKAQAHARILQDA
eukprot:9502687-Karenia_brevis.AAC.1